MSEVGAQAWREWTKSNVGSNKAIRALAVLQRPGPGLVTKSDVKGLTWATCGAWEAKDRELLHIIRSLESRSLHRRVLRLSDVPFLVVHVDVDEYVARSLLTAGQGKGTGLVVRTNATHSLLALYEGEDDSKPASLVHAFAHQFLENAQRSSQPVITID